MKRMLILALLSPILTVGCSNHRLLPTDTSHFTVDSIPPGATVYVMDSALGTTPLVVERKQVFPVTYPPSLQAEYGSLTLKSPGCENYRVPVSNRILETGLVAKMRCQATATAPTTSSPTATAGPADTPAKQRLIQLKELYEEGLITEEEYRSKRKAIINSL